ncbi:OLC1v1004871C1 [Oldenlandia corymbosa var. corymbosa]|uniref:OLC1v1004871C1 n=1 Tax=Oldenlandia corymbosa var. corymbosa TaxID=529605 RepID=A0AAV1DDA5_OLDCO|nr:OLC1v1004871C1 [Oldenlandia corymbosa var. corymbosa]
MASDAGNPAKKTKDEEEKPTNFLDALPREVAVGIISRLPIRSLIQSRFVCKFWRELSCDPHLVNLHLCRVLKSNNPCFIFHCDVPIKNHLYFVESLNQKEDVDGSIKLEKLRRIDAPFSDSVPEFNVIGSCNGIICLEDSLFEEALYLYNPFTQDYAKLPKSRVFEDQVVMYGFGFHPVTNEYKVIKIAFYPSTLDMNAALSFRRFARQRNAKSDVQIFTLGSDRWRSIGSTPFVFQRRSSPVLLNGRLHWTTVYDSYNGRPDRLIVSLDIADEKFREIPGPELNHRMSRQNYHLAVLVENLCVAVPMASVSGTLDVWVMKEYNRKESWVKEMKIPIYTPSLKTREYSRSYGIWRNVLVGKVVRVVCLLSNGDILLEYKGGLLVSYNQDTGMFRDITFPGLPNPCKLIVHVGTLNRVMAPSEILTQPTLA